MLTKIKTEILTSKAFSTIADKMRKKYAAQKWSIDKDIARKQSQLTQAESKRANLYKLVEDGMHDDFTITKIRAAKEAIETLQTEIKTLKKTKQNKILNDREIERAFQLFRQKLNDMSDVESKKLLIDLFLVEVIVTDQQLDIKLSSDAITNMILK